MRESTKLVAGDHATPNPIVLSCVYGNILLAGARARGSMIVWRPMIRAPRKELMIEMIIAYDIRERLAPVDVDEVCNFILAFMSDSGTDWETGCDDVIQMVCLDTRDKKTFSSPNVTSTTKCT